MPEERVMRAKMRCHLVSEQRYSAESEKTGETLHLGAVSMSKYPADGLDEDNTFAKFSPGANLVINVANPALFGAVKFGDEFYVDFLRVPAAKPQGGIGGPGEA